MTERFSDITLRYEDRVARIGINRPDKLNAIRIQTYGELVDALREADASPSCHIIVLEGSQGKFTAGNDLADLVGADPLEVKRCVQGIFDCVSSLQKILVAVVEGVAVGIGTTILLHCDIVVASAETRFRLPFANLGVGPEGGSSVLLPRAIGQRRARELLLTGRFFSADEAYSWGLINAVAEPGNADEKAAEYITQLLQQPVESLIATKKLMQPKEQEIGRVVAEELEVFARLLKKEETRGRIVSLLKGGS